jgi:acyl-[acyl-carrier-protein]-phospholipid O-acyltransferase/long-chain-fatty-acid--[acyl-carrier-protein] ligase
MFRWLITCIGISLFPAKEAQILAGAGACFVLPYLILAAPAGYLADRFSKRTVIVGCKVAEIVLMAIGVFGIWYGSAPWMFVVVGLMGAQSALFSPSKYGVIPELVRARSVPAANGLIGLSTVIGIVVGCVAGTSLADFMKSYGIGGLWLPGVALIGVATIGTIASLQVTRLKPANPQKRFPYNIVWHTFSDLWFLMRRRALITVAVGNAIFWGMGALAQVAIKPYGTDVLGVGDTNVGVMLGVVAIGIGFGSVVSGVWSSGRIELGIVPFGAVVMAIFSIAMFFIAPTMVGPEPDMTVFYWSLVVLFGLGFGGGLYDIPLESFLQRRSDEDSRGRVIAGSNFLSFSAMLLAYGVFYLFTDPKMLDFSTSTVFLISGLSMLPVALIVLLFVPAATARALVWLITRFMYRVKVKGLEHVPEKGGAVFVCNHVSWIDGVLLILAFPRQIRMFAYHTFVDKWWNRWITKEMGTIKVSDSRKSIVHAIREARDGLGSGDLVCVFPEGRITRTGRINEFQPGFLSVRGDLDVPVIPIRLHGLWGSLFSFERGRFFWKWPKRLFRYRVNIIIGEPIQDPTDVSAVRRAVEELAPPEGPEPEAEK